MKIFNGVNFEGWEADPSTWSIVDGAMRGSHGSSRLAYTKADYGTFRLIFTARMNPVNQDHLGILFWGDRPTDASKPKIDEAGWLQFMPPFGGMWDYHPPKHHNLPHETIAQGPKDSAKWSTTEILCNLEKGTMRAAVDGVETVRYTHPYPGERKDPEKRIVAGPIGMFRHGGGASEYKDIYVEVNPKQDNLLTVDSSTSTPALAVLSQFTAGDVPEVGPEEIPIDPPNWKVSEANPNLPGKGLAQHPMLYIGEGCNKMFLINDGKVIWTYSTGKGWEYDDIWLLSNGNILFSRMAWAGEVTPQKKIVWRLDAPKGTEIHSVQPIGLDKVLVMQNGTPAKLMVINKKTGVVEVEHAFPKEVTGGGVHGQFRRARITSQGTYLLSFLQMHKVVEYDKNFNEIWRYNTPQPWAAIRLKNGNTLISDEKDQLVREVNPKSETVWEFKLKTDLPAEIGFSDSQSCVRLANGNTIFCSRGNGGKTPSWLKLRQARKSSGC